MSDALNGAPSSTMEPPPTTTDCRGRSPRRQRARRRPAAPHSGSANRVWWPESLNVKILAKNNALRDPLDEGFDYRAAFEALDLDAVKRDLKRS